MPAGMALIGILLTFSLAGQNPKHLIKFIENNESKKG